MSVPNADSHHSKQTDPIVGSEADQARVHAQAAASYIPFLTTEDLLPPKMPTREEMETVLLELRKQALVEEYFGGNGAS
jgi:pre-mRNA-splicing factor ISY1